MEGGKDEEGKVKGKGEGKGKGEPVFTAGFLFHSGYVLILPFHYCNAHDSADILMCNTGSIG